MKYTSAYSLQKKFINCIVSDKEYKNKGTAFGIVVPKYSVRVLRTREFNFFSYYSFHQLFDLKRSIDENYTRFSPFSSSLLFLLKIVVSNITRYPRVEKHKIHYIVPFKYCLLRQFIQFFPWCFLVFFSHKYGSNSSAPEIRSYRSL